jgi:hypothetical protein
MSEDSRKWRVTTSSSSSEKLDDLESEKNEEFPCTST